MVESCLWWANLDVLFWSVRGEKNSTLIFIHLDERISVGLVMLFQYWEDNLETKNKMWKIMVSLSTISRHDILNQEHRNIEMAENY